MILKIIEVGLSIFNLKNLIARIVITLIHAPPSTNTSCNTNPLHCTSMIGSQSHSAVITFKGVGTIATLGVDNPFFDSFRANNTITTNYPMVMFAF